MVTTKRKTAATINKGESASPPSSNPPLEVKIVCGIYWAIASIYLYYLAQAMFFGFDFSLAFLGIFVAPPLIALGFSIWKGKLWAKYLACALSILIIISIAPLLFEEREDNSFDQSFKSYIFFFTFSQIIILTILLFSKDAKDYFLSKKTDRS